MIQNVVDRLKSMWSEKVPITIISHYNLIRIWRDGFARYADSLYTSCEQRETVRFDKVCCHCDVLDMPVELRILLL